MERCFIAGPEGAGSGGAGKTVRRGNAEAILYILSGVVIPLPVEDAGIATIGVRGTNPLLGAKETALTFECQDRRLAERNSDFPTVSAPNSSSTSVLPVPWQQAPWGLTAHLRSR